MPVKRTAGENIDSRQAEMMTNQAKAARKRALAAIAHLEKARAELDAACADLSSVVGANALYSKIRKLSISTIEVRRLVDYAATTEPWELDHEPTSQELRCGHGPQHGCGKGAK